MLMYCYKCLRPHRYDNGIPASGERLRCVGCGYHFTLYPSGVIVGDFHDYVLHHTDLSGRALSIIFRNVSSVDKFLALKRRDFLRFKNCGSITANELVRFSDVLTENLGLIPNGIDLERKPAIEPDIPDTPADSNKA